MLAGPRASFVERTKKRDTMKTIILFLLTMAVLSGCAVGPNYRAPQTKASAQWLSRSPYSSQIRRQLRPTARYLLVSRRRPGGNHSAVLFAQRGAGSGTRTNQDATRPAGIIAVRLVDGGPLYRTAASAGRLKGGKAVPPRRKTGQNSRLGPIHSHERGIY